MSPFFPVLHAEKKEKAHHAHALPHFFYFQITEERCAVGSRGRYFGGSKQDVLALPRQRGRDEEQVGALPAVGIAVLLTRRRGGDKEEEEEENCSPRGKELASDYFSPSSPSSVLWGAGVSASCLPRWGRRVQQDLSSSSEQDGVLLSRRVRVHAHDHVGDQPPSSHEGSFWFLRQRRDGTSLP